eukprot:131124-Amphidinium_carterae.1
MFLLFFPPASSELGNEAWRRVSGLDGVRLPAKASRTIRAELQGPDAQTIFYRPLPTFRLEYAQTFT